MPATVASLEIARRQTILRLELGQIREVLSDLTRLIESVDVTRDPRFVQSLYYLYQDRATVLRRANRWDEALADLASAERLLDRLAPCTQPLAHVAVAHARALILSDPFNPRADEAEALRHMGVARTAGAPSYLADDFQSRLAFRGGRWAEAAASARKAADALEAQGWLAAAATCRRRAGEASIEIGDLTAAAAQLEGARAQAQRSGSPNDIAHAELAWGRLLSARGEHDDAWRHAETALERFDYLIHNFTTLEDQQRFLVDKLDRYADAFEIALRKDGGEGCMRAWTVAERSKSFYLSQLLASTGVDLFNDSDPEASAALRETEARLDEIDLALAVLRPDEREASKGRDLVARLQQASDSKRALLDRLMQTNPRWARVRVPTSVDLQRVIRELPDNWCLLSYYWGRTGLGERTGAQTRTLHVFWTDGSRQPHHASRTWRAAEVEMLQSARARLHGRVPLGAMLIPPVLTDLLLPQEAWESIPDNSRVLISPHGMLQLLPLHVVSTRDGGYAAGRWAMQYVPTLALLQLQRGGAGNKDVLAIGCPVDGFHDRPLGNVEQELTLVSSIWAGSDRQVRREIVPAAGSPDASGVGIATWGDYGFLHIACHGDFPEGRPFDASLRLGSEAVRVSEFFRVRLQADVASFSACSIGRHAERISGEPVVGDEWVGLYLPLLYGGARCVIASLWEAYSEEAGLFMTALHRALRRGDAPADAVRWAQDSLGQRQLATWANWYPAGLP